MERKKWVRFRHKVVHRLFMLPVRLFFLLFYNFRGERFRNKSVKPPCLILGNHSTPLDPLCLGTSFSFPIYYVASDHIFRLGLASFLLKYLVAPIPIVKSKLDLRTIKDILKVIGEGGSVCLFPEGLRNFNGETAGMNPAVGKLVKQLRVPVVLYRFVGGYLTFPHWAESNRRGRMTGRVVRVITPEELAELTPEQVFEQIRAGLYEDAFASQEKYRVRFRGNRLAEALERVLYLCPGCRGMATLKSKNDIISCPCGVKARFTLLGRLESLGSKPVAFRNVLEWDRWQKRELPQWLAEHTDAAHIQEPLVSDSGQRLMTVDRADKNKLVSTGTFSMYWDKAVFMGEGGTLMFPLNQIARMRVHSKQALQFTLSDGTTYEVKSPFPRSALKYIHLYELINSKDRGVRHDFVFSV